jgi:hypothetical protein
VKDHIGGVTYRWTVPDDADQDLLDALDEQAMERIEEMRKQGYLAGELCANIDGTDYRGWWEAQ